MQRKKTTSLLVVLRRPNSAIWRDYANEILVVDHILHILPSDLVIKKQENFPEGIPSPVPLQPCSALRMFVDRLNIVGGLHEIAIVADRGTSTQLITILNEVLPQLTSDGSLLVAGFQVNAAAFHWMIETCESVTLLDCHLSRGWWKPGSPSAKCSSLNIKLCDGVDPKQARLSQGTWPALKDILVWESDWIDKLSPQHHICAPLTSTKEGAHLLTSALVASLWNPGIQSLQINGSKNLDWLDRLHPNKALSGLDLSNSVVSVDVFRWILKNRSLHTIALAWYPEVRIPWGELKKLKRIRHLYLDDTHLDDKQLAEIALVTRPSMVQAYYTALTHRSWKTILTWPGLKSFWGSQELVEGEFPQDLPDTTGLKECVALNAKGDRFRAVLARYPDVEVVEM